MTLEQNTEAVEKYLGLNNSELMLVFFKFKKYVDSLEQNLKNNTISKQIDTPLGQATAIINVSPEHVEQFKQTEYYKLSHSIIEKLGPVVELLIECDESLRKLADELK